MQNSKNNEAEHFQDEEEQIELPPGGSRSALLIGVVTGILMVAANIVVAYGSSPIHNEVTRLGQNMPLGLAYAAVGIQCLSFFISLLFCFAAGFYVGKIAIKRQFAFYTGAIAGGITGLGGFLVRYIPNYPGSMPANASGDPGALTAGILSALVLMAVWVVIGALVSFWGARTATRKHPYYMRG